MTTSPTSARRPVKRAANLNLSADVLDAAKSLNLNVSQVCNGLLREFIREERNRRWRVEYAAFVDRYNAGLEEEGLPLEEWRSF
jgi:antitoxin CcdA